MDEPWRFTGKGEINQGMEGQNEGQTSTEVCLPEHMEVSATRHEADAAMSDAMAKLHQLEVMMTQPRMLLPPSLHARL